MASFLSAFSLLSIHHHSHLSQWLNSKTLSIYGRRELFLCKLGQSREQTVFNVQVPKEERLELAY